MSDWAWGVAVVLVTIAPWVAGAVLQWHHKRQLEGLVACVRRSLRHAPRPVKPAGVHARPFPLRRRPPARWWRRVSPN